MSKQTIKKISSANHNMHTFAKCTHKKKTQEQAELKTMADSGVTDQELITFHFIRLQYEKRYKKVFSYVLKQLISKFAEKCIKCPALSIQEDMSLLAMLSKQLKFNIQRISILFRASENNFEAKQFHSICDNSKSPKIVIIQSQWGNIFGGYTSQSFKQPAPGKYFKKDNDAFLFLCRSDDANIQSLCPLIFKVRSDAKKYAICCDDKTGPCFGDGWDVHIGDKCATRKKCDGNDQLLSEWTYVNCCKLSTFECNGFVDLNLCGGDSVLYDEDGLWSEKAYGFTVKDYEVFELK